MRRDRQSFVQWSLGLIFEPVSWVLNRPLKTLVVLLAAQEAVRMGTAQPHWQVGHNLNRSGDIHRRNDSLLNVMGHNSLADRHQAQDDPFGILGAHHDHSNFDRLLDSHVDARYQMLDTANLQMNKLALIEKQFQGEGNLFFEKQKQLSLEKLRIIWPFDSHVDARHQMLDIANLQMNNLALIEKQFQGEGNLFFEKQEQLSLEKLRIIKQSLLDAASALMIAMEAWTGVSVEDISIDNPSDYAAMTVLGQLDYDLIGRMKKKIEAYLEICGFKQTNIFELDLDSADNIKSLLKEPEEATRHIDFTYWHGWYSFSTNRFELESAVQKALAPNPLSSSFSDLSEAFHKGFLLVLKESVRLNDLFRQDGQHVRANKLASDTVPGAKFVLVSDGYASYVYLLYKTADGLFVNLHSLNNELMLSKDLNGLARVTLPRGENGFKRIIPKIAERVDCVISPDLVVIASQKNLNLKLKHYTTGFHRRLWGELPQNTKENAVEKANAYLLKNTPFSMTFYTLYDIPYAMSGCLNTLEHVFEQYPGYQLSRVGTPYSEEFVRSFSKAYQYAQRALILHGKLAQMEVNLQRNIDIPPDIRERIFKGYLYKKGPILFKKYFLEINFQSHAVVQRLLSAESYSEEFMAEITSLSRGVLDEERPTYASAVFDAVSDSWLLLVAFIVLIVSIVSKVFLGKWLDKNAKVIYQKEKDDYDQANKKLKQFEQGLKTLVKNTIIFSESNGIRFLEPAKEARQAQQRRALDGVVFAIDFSSLKTLKLRDQKQFHSGDRILANLSEVAVEKNIVLQKVVEIFKREFGDDKVMLDGESIQILYAGGGKLVPGLLNDAVLEIIKASSEYKIEAQRQLASDITQLKEEIATLINNHKTKVLKFFEENQLEEKKERADEVKSAKTTDKVCKMAKEILELDLKIKKKQEEIQAVSNNLGVTKEDLEKQKEVLVSSINLQNRRLNEFLNADKTLDSFIEEDQRKIEDQHKENAKKLAYAIRNQYENKQRLKEKAEKEALEKERKEAWRRQKKAVKNVSSAGSDDHRRPPSPEKKLPVVASSAAFQYAYEARGSNNNNLDTGLQKDVRFNVAKDKRDLIKVVLNDSQALNSTAFGNASLFQFCFKLDDSDYMKAVNLHKMITQDAALYLLMKFTHTLGQLVSQRSGHGLSHLVSHEPLYRYRNIIMHHTEFFEDHFNEIILDAGSLYKQFNPLLVGLQNNSASRFDLHIDLSKTFVLTQAQDQSQQEKNRNTYKAKIRFIASQCERLVLYARIAEQVMVEDSIIVSAMTKVIMSIGQTLRDIRASELNKFVNEFNNEILIPANLMGHKDNTISLFEEKRNIIGHHLDADDTQDDRHFTADSLTTMAVFEEISLLMLKEIAAKVNGKLDVICNFCQRHGLVGSANKLKAG